MSHFIQAKEICNVLSLSGGGSYGAIELGIIKKYGLPEDIDLVTGISVGALNGAIISGEDTIDEAIERLDCIWNSITCDEDIYSYSIFNLGQKWALYDNKPLIEMMKKNIKSIKKNFIVGATNLNTRKLDIFKISNMKPLRIVDYLTASSSIPLLFPPYIEKGVYYIDGGTISNEILYNLDEYIPYECDYYNITFITTFNIYETPSNITSSLTYILDIINTLFNHNTDLYRFKTTYCKTKAKGKIHILYPKSTSPSLFNMLDFSNIPEKIEMGKEADYTIVNYC